MDLGDGSCELLPKKDRGRGLAIPVGGVSYTGNPCNFAGTSEPRKKGPKTEIAKREREEPESMDVTVKSSSVLGKYEVSWKNGKGGGVAGAGKPLSSFLGRSRARDVT